MAVNPGEDIVNVWLQDVCGYFTIQNVNVPKIKNGKKTGGRGKEIDIIGIQNDGKCVWCEVSVSPSPRKDKNKNLVKEFSDKFCNEKAKIVSYKLNSKKYKKWFVYSGNLFPKKSKEKEENFKKEMKKKGIICFNFQDEVLNPTINSLKHYSVDPTRIFLYYLKYFDIKK